MKTDVLVALSMLEALSGADARRAAVEGAARARLNDADFDLFMATWGTTASIRRRRNEYAHGIWGYSPKIPDGLLHISPRYLTSHYARWEQARRETESGVLASGIDREKTMVYKEADFAADLHRVREADRYLGLMMYVFDDAPGPRSPPSQLRDELLKQPEIARALAKRTRPHGSTAEKETGGSE